MMKKNSVVVTLSLVAVFPFANPLLLVVSMLSMEGGSVRQERRQPATLGCFLVVRFSLSIHHFVSSISLV